MSGCQAETRPGTVETIGGAQGGNVSVSAAAPPSPGVGATPGGLLIPAGLPPSTSGPTKSDGIYTPTTNRESYQKIATDYQEIVALTNQVVDGKPLPAAEILLLYEAGKHTRIGVTSRSMRIFAREAARATEFPEAVAFYKNPTFLDTEINDAIAGARTAADYTPAQKRQAIQKGIQRIIYYWVRRYVDMGKAGMNPGLVDEAWAIYMGEEKDGKYPSSISATAVSREANFNRGGTVDEPLRRAMSQMQKAANDKNTAAMETAYQDTVSRLHTIFYLSAARYLNESVKATLAGKPADAAVAQVEGYSYYLTIQPLVAKADLEADKAIVDFYKSDPTKLTNAARDTTLAALNRTSSALLLKQSDIVTTVSFQ